LGKIGDERAVEALIKALDDDDPNLRASAASALGEIRDIRALEPLTEALGDGNLTVSCCAAFALGMIGDSYAVKPLIQLLNRPNLEVQQASLWALGEIKSARAMKTLIELNKNNNPKIQKAATDTLEKICSLSAVTFGAGLDMIPKRTFLHNPDVAGLVIPMQNLSRIIINSESHNFYLVERFITYAVNYIGRDYLKKNVEVHVYGDSEKLHGNLRNLFENLFKTVRFNR